MTPADRLPHEDLCTVDDAAAHLRVHRKTVLRYIRDGRLSATKIGKAYRIRRVDLDAFGGSPEPAPPRPGAARVTSIVDVDDVGPQLAARLAAAVRDALHGQRDGARDVHAEVVHDAERSQVKVVVVGSIDDTRGVLGLLEVWLDQLTP